MLTGNWTLMQIAENVDQVIDIQPAYIDDVHGRDDSFIDLFIFSAL
jgi:hypothetical protein